MTQRVERPQPVVRTCRRFSPRPKLEVPNAEGVGAFGRILGFVGTMLGIGGLVFADVVLHGHRGDTLAVLRLVRYSAYSCSWGPSSTSWPT